MQTCTKNGVERCDAPFCDKDHTELMLTVWKDRSGETTETFCLDHWTPEHVAAFRDLVASAAVCAAMPGVPAKAGYPASRPDGR